MAVIGIKTGNYDILIEAKENERNTETANNR